MNAIGACGLALYNFGQSVSLVFFTETWKPDSFYDRVKENTDIGLHTLLLLDIKVKEPSEENLARLVISTCRTLQLLTGISLRGRKIYEPPRYMSIPQAVSQLIETEGLRVSGTLSAEKTLAIGMSRVGGGDEHQRIVCGTLAELASHPADAFGEPLHSLIIVGKRLHPLEVEFAEDFAISRDTWREVAKSVYECALDQR